LDGLLGRFKKGNPRRSPRLVKKDYIGKGPGASGKEKAQSTGRREKTGSRPIEKEGETIIGKRRLQVKKLIKQDWEEKESVLPSLCNPKLDVKSLFGEKERNKESPP